MGMLKKAQDMKNNPVLAFFTPDIFAQRVCSNIHSSVVPFHKRSPNGKYVDVLHTYYGIPSNMTGIGDRTET